MFDQQRNKNLRSRIHAAMRSLRTPNIHPDFLLGSVLIGLVLGVADATVAIAQIVPDNTLGNERSHLTPTDVIEGGATRGANLFHSLSEFNVSEGQQVYFANPAGVDRILSRITGNSRSEILGTLGVLGNADLFLINPNGIVFGANAKLDIQGSFIASTASSLKFPDGSEFSATHPQPAPLLKVNLTPGLQYGSSRQGATIANAGNLSVGQDLTLIADNLDLQGQLQAGRDLTMQATDTVRVRDSLTLPFSAHSGRDLTIQGDRAIDILALNHLPQSAFISGGNLTLISDGQISTDAHFTSGGDFAIQKRSGNPGNFVSLRDPVFTVGGDYSIGDYFGTSLLVDAGGNIDYGTVIINDIDPAVHPTNPALFLNAGGRITGTGDVLTSFEGGRLLVKFQSQGDINIQQIRTRGGSIALNSSAGSITTNGASLDTTNDGSNGGSITLNAFGSIRTGNLDTSAIASSATIDAGNGGAIQLTTVNGDIETGDLKANTFSDTDSNAGNGGNIQLKTTNGNIVTGLLNTSTFALNAAAGDGGAIKITTTNGNITTTDVIANAGDVTPRYGNPLTARSGNGGAIQLTAANGSIVTEDISTAALAFRSPGKGGNVTVSAAGNIQSDFVDAYSLAQPDSSTSRSNDGGTVRITSTTGNIDLNGISTVSVANVAGNGGSVDVTAAQGNLNVLSVSSSTGADAGTSSGRAGDVRLSAEQVKITGYFVDAFSRFGQGGSILFNSQKSTILPSLNTTGRQNSGSITVRSEGNLSVDLGRVIASDTFGAGQGGNIEIAARSITLTRGAQISASTHSTGPGGNIRLKASDSVTLSGILPNGEVPDTFAPAGIAGIPEGTYLGGYIPTGDATQIDRDRVRDNIDNTQFPSGVFSQTTVGSTGNAGNISIETGQVTIQDGAAIAATTFGRGDGGNISLTSPNGEILLDSRGSILSGAALGSFGNSGTIDVQSQRLTLQGAGLIQTQTLGQGSAGTIQVNAGDTINLEGVDSAIRSGSGDGITPDNAIGKGGDIRLTTGNLQVTDGATLNAQTYTASEGGNVIVNASRFQANQGGQLRTTTSGKGEAGDIIVNATDRVDLTDTGTGLFANTTGGFGGAVSVTTDRFEITRNAVLDATTTTASPGGSVTVRTNTFNATQGGQLRTTTSGEGRAGDIIVYGADRVDLTDAGTGLFANTTSGPGGAIAVTTNRLQIARGAVLDATTTGANPAGNVTVRANTFNATEGGQVRTTTSGSGQAGDIALEVTNLTLAGSGTGLFASTASDSTGRGGNIRIDSQTIDIQDSARVAVDSQGKGEGGNIGIQTSSMLLNQQAAISAETVSNTGGNITLDVSDLLLLRRNSFISTTAGKAQGAGNGGNIDLSAGFIIAVPNENSDITANAFRGRGGNITITTQGIFGIEFRDRQTPLSDITASSRFGVNGVVTINTPGIDPVQGAVELPTTFSTPSLAQGCQARGSQTSRFVNTGRGGVSTNPTDPLIADTIWQDLELLEETGKGAREQPTTNNQRLRTNNLTPPIIEAQGWVVLSNGTIALTAEAPKVTPYGMGSKGSSVFCH